VREPDAHHAAARAEEHEPDDELQEIELKILGEVAEELVGRSPFQSARIDGQRFEERIAGAEERDGKQHQAKADPDRPPVFLQIELFPP
jgi:hypothetical protein